MEMMEKKESQMYQTSIKVSVIILFYNGENWLDSCLQSLDNQTLSDDEYEIILVDNGGTTPGISKYENKKNTRLLHFPENYGFAGGNNKALPEARGEYVFLLNQDAIIHPDCLNKMLEAFRNNSDAAVIAANMQMVLSNDLTSMNEDVKTVGYYKTNSFGYSSYCNTVMEREMLLVNFVSGNGLGFRKAVINGLGGYLFDSGLGSYMEDLDLSLRLEKAGIQMFVCTEAVVYHFRDEIFSDNALEMLGKLIHVSGNRLIVHFNNFKRADFLKKLPLLILGIPLKVARFDEEDRLHILKVLIAFAVLPVIFLYFLLRLIAAGEERTAEMDSVIDKPNSVKKSRRYLQCLMFLLFFVIAVVFLSGQDWQGIYQAVHNVKPSVIILLIGLTVFAHIIRTLRTQFVFFKQGYKTRFREMFAINLTSQFSGVMTPAGVGTFVAAPLLKLCFKIPLAFSSFFVVVDRVFGIYFMIFFAGLGMIGYLTGLDNSYMIFLPILFFTSWLFFYALNLSDKSIHRFGVPPYGGELLNLLGNDIMIQIVMLISKSVYFGTIIFQYIIIADALNIPIGIVNAWMIISISFLAGIVSMIPMGLVSRDASLLVLSSLAGVPASTGLIIIVLMRAVTSIPTAVLGSLSGIWLGKLRNRNNDQN